ncbi:MAG TPA: DUF4198 domain-containing protein [Gemmataceae bacterium]|nr:DUF4198 domain-containing protein [Gemmataceae bacterium]
MRSRIPVTLPLLLLGLTAPAAWGHFNMLLPDRHSVKRGETVTFTYQWGHPFEHQLFDAPAPQELWAFAPDSKRIDLLTSLEKITVPGDEGKQVTAYRFRFTPEQRGDYIFFLRPPPIWMEEDKEFLQDTVKVVLHVQTQKGWAHGVGGFELVPLTRPYGLEPGMVFQAQVTFADKPLAGPLVEIERYNPTPPKELPPDEHITRAVKADPNGVVTCTLTEPGWWGLTANFVSTTKEYRDGKGYPLRYRSTLWVFVDEKVAPRPEK